MKTSYKVLVTTAGILVALLIIGLAVFRNDMHTLINSELFTRYRIENVDPFTRLDFSSNWNVKIRQGYKYKVELEDGANLAIIPQLENINGTLYFKLDTTNGPVSVQNFRARVTAPSLEMIKALGNTQIHMTNFLTDSLNVIIENGVSFTGHNNQFDFVSIVTSGDNRLLFTKDEWQ